jgi:hypothetical protein
MRKGLAIDKTRTTLILGMDFKAALLPRLKVWLVIPTPISINVGLAKHMQPTAIPRQHTNSQLNPLQHMFENLLTMDQRRPPEYIIEVFADPSSVKDVVRGRLLLSLSFHSAKEE